MRKIILLTLILCASAAANAQSSGGTFNITHSVTASGGETMTASGGVKMDGTIAQPGAGDEMANPPFALRGGFWNPIIAPTAATASIGGRVLAPDGQPLKNAAVSLTGGNMFNPRRARTNAFGYFTFEEVEVGQFYILTVSSKRFGFANMTQSFTLTDNFTDVVFQASWEN